QAIAPLASLAAGSPNRDPSFPVHRRAVILRFVTRRGSRLAGGRKCRVKPANPNRRRSQPVVPQLEIPLRHPCRSLSDRSGYRLHHRFLLTQPIPSKLEFAICSPPRVGVKQNPTSNIRHLSNIRFLEGRRQSMACKSNEN